MTIELRWDDIHDSPVLVYHFHPGWTWRDFNQTKQRADSLLARSSVNIPLIFDLRHAPDMPPGMLKQTRSATETRHLNGSPIIIIGASKMIQTTFSIVKRMIGQRGHLMDDILFVDVWDEVPILLRHYSRS